MSVKVSGIIPAYEEGSRLLGVLAKLIQVKNLDEIIVVDDGSQDFCQPAIAKLYPQVKFFRLPEHRGKSAAVAYGLARAQGEYIFLCDADLQNLIPSEIQSAIQAIITRPQVDMIILKRVIDYPLAKLARGNLIYSGERILKKADLVTVLAQGGVEDYQLEVAINIYMQARKKSVFWVPHSGINVLKASKWGRYRGWTGELRMVEEMIAFAGLRKFCKQQLLFGWRKFK